MRLAELAAQANADLENIGARRLMTVMEKVFEEIAFDAPDMAARGETSVEITESFVRKRLRRFSRTRTWGDSCSERTEPRRTITNRARPSIHP